MALSYPYSIHSPIVRRDTSTLYFKNNAFRVTNEEDFDIYNCQLSICSPDEATQAVYHVKGKADVIEIKNLTGTVMKRCFCVVGHTERKIFLKDKAYHIDLPNGYATVSEVTFRIDNESGAVIVENHGGSAIYVVVDFEPDEVVELSDGDRIIFGDVKSLTCGTSYIENETNELDVWL